MDWKIGWEKNNKNQFIIENYQKIPSKISDIEKLLGV